MKRLNRVDLEYINHNHTNATVIKNDRKDHQYLLVGISVATAIIALILGIILIIDFNPVISTYILAGLAALIAVGLIYLFLFVAHTNNKVFSRLGLAALILVGAFLVYLIPVPIAFLFRLTTAVLSLIGGAFILINTVRLFSVKAPFGRQLVLGLIYIALSLIILFGPYASRLFMIGVGIYLILIACTSIYESLTGFLKEGSINDSYMLSTPTILSFFLPIALYNKLNTMVREEPDEILTMQEHNNLEDPDLIIYIQTRSGILLGFGHVDFCFDGKVYSFGDYNNKYSKRLGNLISDGVLATIPPEININYELKDNAKMIIAYGLKLTPEQKQKVHDKLDEIMEKSTVWVPPIHDKDGNTIVPDPDHYQDDGKRIYMKSIAHFFMFDETSPYRLYYGVGENCSKFVNDVVGVTGVKLKSLSGIITPGSYLVYLDKLYNMKNTAVTERRLYSLNSDGVPLEYPEKIGKPFKLNKINVEF